MDLYNHLYNQKKGKVDVLLFLFGIAFVSLAVAYFVVEEELLRNGVLYLLAVALVLGVVYSTIRFTSASHKLSKKLQRLNSLTGTAALEKIREVYLEVYRLYMKLSERQKRHFYESVRKIREVIEAQLQAEKEVQLLLQQAGKGSMEEQHKNYDELHRHFQKLPKKVQEKYYSQIVDLKGKLEGGSLEGGSEISV